MSRVASLGMYDHPAQHAANDRLWAAIALSLRNDGVDGVPDRLDRSRPVQALWRDPELLLGQVCGYPLITDPSLSLQLLALPVYAAPGCVGDIHSSVIVARSDEPASTLSAFRGRRAAINERSSNSGMNLFRAAVGDLAAGTEFFASVDVTGSHRESVRAVVRGVADIAAIDAVTYAALARFEPDLTAGLQIIAHTPPSPTLPFVTGRDTDIETAALIRKALAAAIADPDLGGVRADLFLAGLMPATIGRFAPLRDLERRARLAGYPELR